MPSVEELEDEFNRTKTIPEALHIVYRCKLYAQSQTVENKGYSVAARRMMQKLYDECYKPSEMVGTVEAVIRDPKPKSHEIGGKAARRILDTVDEGMFLLKLK